MNNVEFCGVPWAEEMPPRGTSFTMNFARKEGEKLKEERNRRKDETKKSE